MALFAFHTVRVTAVPPPLQGAACAPWCHALWQAQGTGGGSARFSQHREVSVPQPCHPCSALHTLQGSCLAPSHAVCLPSGSSRQEEGTPPCPRAASAGALMSLCTLQSSGLGCIQHRALQPAGSLTAPAPTPAPRDMQNICQRWAENKNTSTPLALAPALYAPRHSLSPAGKSSLALGTPKQDQRPSGCPLLGQTP